MSPSRFERILRNPSLYPGVAAALGPGFPWHTHAASPRSSQALCVSAWAPLGALEARHAVIDGFLGQSLPGLQRRSGLRWEVALEVSDPDLLHERGAPATTVDVLLEAGDAVVAVESKFLRDAQAVFRGCGQFPHACRGYHGPGSHKATGSGAACRLAVRDSRREARSYWDVAAGLFRPEALAPGKGEPGSCPLHRFYQLARTLFFAVRSAQLSGRRESAALVIAPAATAGLLERQTAVFAAEVLLPEHAGRVAVVHYERLAEVMLASADQEAVAVGAFVAGLLPVAPSAPPRAETARDLRRRAEAERRARRHAGPHGRVQ